MRQLKHRLPWLSADYSGAAGVFYEMDGMTILCDPGACTGNILAYDEPRMDFRKPFYSMQLAQKQVVFGLDQELLQKALPALQEQKPECFLILGTPISATLAADYKGLAGMLSARTGSIGFGVDTSGVDTYDVGERKMLQAFADQLICADPDGSVDVNVLGATPLNMWDLNQVKDLIAFLNACGFSSPSVWGRNGKVSRIRQAAGAKLNLAVSASAVPVVKKLRERYGTPYRIGFPIGERQTAVWGERLSKIAAGGTADAAAGRAKEAAAGETAKAAAGEAAEAAACGTADPAAGSAAQGVFSEGNSGRALIVGEQVFACAIRDCLRSETGYRDVQVASFFGMAAELMEDGDRRLADEEALIDMALCRGGYDLVICDPLMYPILPYRPAHTMPCPHTAVSGRLYLTRGANLFGAKGSAYIREKIR